MHINRLVNKNKFCRYSDIRTYKDNTVLINLESKDRYINASWIHIPEPRFFIATQGPLESTIEDFWDMCFLYEVKIIIMICKLKEKNIEKCSNYWEIYFGTYQVQTLNIKYIDGIIYRKIQIKNKKNSKERSFLQLQLTTWDDHTAPIENYKRIIEIIDYIDMNKDNNPVVVHCSAGVGRTGTFISLYILYKEIIGQIIDDNQKEIIFSIMNTVRKLKELRQNLVENEKQYNLLYKFINLLLIDKN